MIMLIRCKITQLLDRRVETLLLRQSIYSFVNFVQIARNSFQSAKSKLSVNNISIIYLFGDIITSLIFSQFLRQFILCYKITIDFYVLFISINYFCHKQILKGNQEGRITIRSNRNKQYEDINQPIREEIRSYQEFLFKQLFIKSTLIEFIKHKVIKMKQVGRPTSNKEIPLYVIYVKHLEAPWSLDTPDVSEH